ncbi:MAG: SGNH/GDSL hydrolase family protein [Candidatus Sericytochromatia bacterium]|nr:SGNH/GDSL hydrolase family protein [Candidatus Sericytochromatia bacterium]
MLRLLALGDSYTIGEGLEPADAWPRQLITALRHKDQLCEDPRIIARTGWTSHDLLQAIDTAAPELTAPYDLVSLLIGVNNQYQGLPMASYEQELEQLIERALELNGQRPGRLLMLSIPNWGLTPFAAGRDREAIAAEIKAFNQINARAAYQRGLLYLNLDSFCNEARRDPRLLSEDQLHYAPLMYTRWVKNLILPRVWRLLQPAKNLHVPLLPQIPLQTEAP